MNYTNPEMYEEPPQSESKKSAPKEAVPPKKPPPFALSVCFLWSIALMALPFYIDALFRLSDGLLIACGMVGCGLLMVGLQQLSRVLKGGRK